MSFLKKTLQKLAESPEEETIVGEETGEEIVTADLNPEEEEEAKNNLNDYFYNKIEEAKNKLCDAKENLNKDTLLVKDVLQYIGKDPADMEQKLDEVLRLLDEIVK